MLSSPSYQLCQSLFGFYTYIQYMVFFTISDWVFSLVSKPQIHPRKLWCAFSDNLERPFSVECEVNSDDVEKLIEKIWERTPESIKQLAIDSYYISLYSPVVQLNYTSEFNIEHGIFLHPRKTITSRPVFPRSEDPNVDIVVVVDGGARRNKRAKTQDSKYQHVEYFLSCL